MAPVVSGGEGEGEGGNADQTTASARAPGGDGVDAPTFGDPHHFEWLLANLPGLIYRCAADAGRAVQFVSNYVQDLTGLAPAAFAGPDARTLGAVVHPSDRDHLRAVVAEAIEVGGRFQAEYRIVHVDGSVRWVSDQGRIVRDEHGAPRWVDGVMFDVTARKRMERAEARRSASLARQRRALVEIATNPSVGVGKLRPAAYVITEAMAWALDASRASVWLLDDGRQRLRLVDLFVADVDEHQHDLVLEAADVPRYFTAMQTGRIVDAHDARTDARTSEFLEGYLEPLDIHSMLDAAIRTGGEVVGVVCIEQTGATRHWEDHELNFAGEIADQVAQVLLNRDHRQATEERERLQAQLFRAQKMEAVGRLAGGVAHDFNNLITAIAGYAGLLLEDLDADDPRREDAVEIAATTDRARELTRQLLAFSRREEIEIHPVDLGRVVSNLERMLERLIEEAFSLQIEIGHEHLIVRGNEGLIEQVLTNLVVNARDAMPRGGAITIATGRAVIDGMRGLELDGIDPGEYGWVQVADAGVGIPADHLAKIFEPFFTTKEAGHGTGLGLSTVYGIARRCGGSVEVRSVVGEGTTFTVYFPVSTHADLAREGESANDRGGGLVGRGRRIVVVEDERAVRELAVRVLARAGFEVTAAHNGAVAMALLSDMDELPALVLSDMIMPEAGGIDVLQWIRQHMPGTPVLLMSGYVDEPLRRRAEGVPRLAKPFTPAELRRRVLELVDGDVPAVDRSRADAPRDG